MSSIYSENCPLNLFHCVTTIAAQSHRQGLRSVSTSNYILPHHYTKFGERTFSNAGPRAWNSFQIWCAVHPASLFLNDA
jgi:hypothetical protein